MNSIPAENNSESKKLSWQHVVAKYNNPDLRRSAWQVFNSFVPYFALWYVMYRSLAVS